MDDLKPCPFCGYEPTIRIFKGKNGWRDRYAVICRYDEGGCGAESGLYHYEAEAVESWNRRTETERKTGKWIDDGLDGIGIMGIEYRWQKCSLCGYRFSKAPFQQYPNFCEECGARMDGDTDDS